MKKLLIASFLAILAGTAHANLLLEDFSSFAAELPSSDGSWSFGGIDQYVQNSGFISVTPVSGGNPRDDGSFTLSNSSFDLTGLSWVAVSARVDSGNAAGSFSLTFYDGSLNAATASFAAASFSSSFSTVAASLSYAGGFDSSNVVAWQIGGGNFTPANDFRMSFNQIDVMAVPEPGAVWLMFFGIALLFPLARLRRARGR